MFSIAIDPSLGSFRRNSSTSALLNGNMSSTGVNPTMPIRRLALSATLVSSKRRKLLDAAGTGRHLAGYHAIRPLHHGVGRAWHAWIERANGAQDIYTLERILITEIGFDNRRVQDRLLICSRGSPGRLRTGVDCRRRHNLIIGEESVLDLTVVTQEATPRPPEANADRVALRRYFERCRDLGLASLLQVEGAHQILQCYHQIEGDGIGARAIALEGVPGLRNLPLEFHGRQVGRRDVELKAFAGRSDVVAFRQLLRERRNVHASIRAGLEGPPIPCRGRRPGVPLLPVLGSRPRNCRLVPGMVRREWVA